MRLWRRRTRRPKIGFSTLITPAHHREDWPALLEKLHASVEVEDHEPQPGQTGEGTVLAGVTRGDSAVELNGGGVGRYRAHAVTLFFHEYDKNLALGKEVEALLLREGFELGGPSLSEQEEQSRRAD